MYLAYLPKFQFLNNPNNKSVYNSAHGNLAIGDTMTNFQEKLGAAQKKNDSLVCVGLDPDLNMMAIQDVAEFNRAIIDATSDIACCYKPNLAFYEALGMDGLKALEKTIDCVPSHIPIIGDAKRGDIGSTAKAYADAMFLRWGFDATTISPYLGRDSVEPFIEHTDKGVLVLCHTSNPGSKDFQELYTNDEGDQKPLYVRIATKALEWDIAGNIGLVFGATYSSQLMEIRQICPDMVILAPGIGAQGGDLLETVTYGTDKNGNNLIINSSRGIIYSSRDSTTFSESARQSAEDLRTQINNALGK